MCWSVWGSRREKKTVTDRNITLSADVYEKYFSNEKTAEVAEIVRKHWQHGLKKGERQMFSEIAMQVLDKTDFNIVLTGDYDVTVQSIITGHSWYVHKPEIPGEDACINFHRHRASHPYHQHGQTRNLRQAVSKIKGHDVFQMNGRR